MNTRKRYPRIMGIVSILLVFILGNLITSAQGQESAPWQGSEYAWQAQTSKYVGVPGDVERHSPKKVAVDPTGGFNLEIPLLTVPGRGGLDFDLTLNYQPGIKVMQEASWVGLGWNLGIGSITRNIVVRCDREVNQKFSGAWENSWDELRDNFSIVCPAGGGTILQFPQQGNPDYFDFMLEEWREWKITYDKSRHRFIVVTENGTTYVFGLGAVGLSSNILRLYSPDEQLQVPNPYEPYMQWFLIAILSSDYIDGPSADPYDPLDTAAPATDNNGNWVAIRWDYDMVTLGENDPKKWFAYVYWTNPFVTKVNLYEVTYPYRIVTPTHVAEFTTETEESNILSYLQDYVFSPGGTGEWAPDLTDIAEELKRRLRTIKLYRYSGSGSDPDYDTLIREVEFSYHDGEDRPRTMLKEVQIENDGQSLPPYKMEYYHQVDPEPNYYSMLPGGSSPQISGRVGRWGWYNGRPNYGYDYSDDGLPTDGRAWNLKRLTYPAGGFMELNYESDRPGEDVFDAFPVFNIGGCRLTSQTIDDGAGSSETFTYTYKSRHLNGTEEAGAGREYISPLEYFTHFWADTYEQEIRGSQYSEVSEMVLYGQNEYTTYYEEVTEDLDVIEGVPRNGKVVSHFSVRKFDDNLNYPQGLVDPAAVYEKTLRNRGNLVKREFYSASGIKVKEEAFDRVENVKAVYTVGASNYPVHMSVWKSQETITTTHYEQGGNIATTTTVEYNDKNGLLKRKTETNSDETWRITKFKYPVDYTNTTGTGDAYEQAIHAMRTTEHMYSPVIEKEIREKPLGQTEKVVAAELVKYKRFPNEQIYPGEIYPYEAMKFSSLVSVSDFVESNITSGTFNSDTRYRLVATDERYDNYGNLIQSVDANNASSTATVWAYASSLPVGRVRNSSPQKASISVFDDGDHSAWTSLYGTWQILNDAYLAQTNPNAYETWNNPRINISVGIGEVDDAVLEADIQFAGTGFGNPQPRIGLAKYVNDLNYIRFELRRTESRVRIFVVNSGDTRSADATFPVNQFQWYHVRCTVQGDVAKLYIDGELLVTLTHSYVGSLTTGQIGLCSYQTIAYFDNVRFYPISALVTSTSYHPIFLKPNVQTDESGVSTSFGYDPLGRLTSVRNGDGNLVKEVAYFYSSPFSATDPNHVQEKTYRGVNLLTTNTTFYDGLGRKIQTQIHKGTNDIVQHYTFDNLGRIDRTYKPFEPEERPPHEYLPFSQIPANICYEDTDYESNPLNRVSRIVPYCGTASSDISITYGNSTFEGSSALYRYVETSDEREKVKREFFDNFGNLIGVIAADGTAERTVTRFTYDVLGNLKQSQAPIASDVTTYVYNTLSQLLEKTATDFGIVKYRYDKNGNLRFQQDENQRSANEFTYFKYDVFNRLIEQGVHSFASTYFDNATYYENRDWPSDGAWKIKNTYDVSDLTANYASGRLTKTEVDSDGDDPDVVTRFKYDKHGRILEKRVAFLEIPEKVITYQYDWQGNVIRTINPSGLIVDRNYNEQNQLQHIKLP